MLTYELSTVPFALSHVDGSLRKTTKSVCMTELERVVPAEGRLHAGSNMPTCFIFDAMALIQKVPLHLVNLLKGILTSSLLLYTKVVAHE